jgi:hypothetical protein
VGRARVDVTGHGSFSLDDRPKRMDRPVSSTRSPRNVGIDLEHSFIDFGSQHYHPRRMTACCAAQPAEFLRTVEKRSAHQDSDSLAPKGGRKKSMNGHQLCLHYLWG